MVKLGENMRKVSIFILIGALCMLIAGCATGAVNDNRKAATF